jgi:hypothetical protein
MWTGIQEAANRLGNAPRANFMVVARGEEECRRWQERFGAVEEYGEVDGQKLFFIEEITKGR